MGNRTIKIRLPSGRLIINVPVHANEVLPDIRAKKIAPASGRLFLKK